MSPRYLLDSNVLVYALDAREPEKRERARDVIRGVALAGSGALPAQALSEFSNVCLRKLEPPLAPPFSDPALTASSSSPEVR